MHPVIAVGLFVAGIAMGAPSLPDKPLGGELSLWTCLIAVRL